MKLSVSILGSGSGGNATLIHTDHCAILIDAGLSRKQILLRMEKLSISPSILAAILLTHDHADHIKGARLLADQLNIPTYLTSTIFPELSHAHKLGRKICLFDPGTHFSIGPFELIPFEIPHTTLQPVGLSIECANHKIGFATDLGSMNSYIKGFLRDCTTIILESDYDKQMLMASDRPLHLKRKIMGQFGHLGNDQVIDALQDITTKHTRHIFLVHLSTKCNKEDIVYQKATERLQLLHHGDLSLHVVSSAHCPYPTVDISPL